MINKLIASTGLSLALAAALLAGTSAAAADEPAQAPTTRQDHIVVARTSTAPSAQHLDETAVPTGDEALSQALENLARDNESELELRMTDYISGPVRAGM